MPADKGPNMEVRAFIAVVLSLGVMLGYQYFFTTPEPEFAVESQLEAPPAGDAETSSPPISTELPERARAAGEEPQQTGSPEGLELVAGESRRTTVLETDSFRMTVDNQGAVIRSLTLNDYEADFGGGPLELVVTEPGFEPGAMLMLTHPQRPELAEAANNALYRMTIDGRAPPGRLRVTQPTEVRWEWVDASGWRIDKRLVVDPQGYLSHLSVSVRSPSGEPLFLMMGPGLEMNSDTTRTGMYLMRGGIVYDGAAVEQVASADLESPLVGPTNMVWAGIQSSFFLGALVADAEVTTLFSAVPLAVLEEGEAADQEPSGNPGTQAAFALELPPGRVVEMPMYTGPKDYDILLAAGHGLEQAIDYGMFRILARPVAVVLQTFNEYTGNYGLAIILATLGVRLLFFPLSQSSMKSMRKMQQLAPQMNAIKAKYKGVKDVQKKSEMNAEVMQLYKDNGVSPLGGCLPMLLQMPVLFGFYSAISVSIGLRHAPFTLWIHDLSMMDPYYVLPLMMGAAMYGQQRMSPGTGDPVQQKIFRLMPVMFTFFFLTFPSGLVIYWLVNTGLGIGQQALVNHQLGTPPAKAIPARKNKKKGGSGGGAKRKKTR